MIAPAFKLLHHKLTLLSELRTYFVTQYVTYHVQELRGMNSRIALAKFCVLEDD
jgi:hypothetical protein